MLGRLRAKHAALPAALPGDARTWRVSLAPVFEATERLLATLSATTDGEAAGPSRLEGWTRAMVATHVARNADSNAAMVEALLRGERREQYPGGRAERAAGIEAGRGRTAAECLADVRETADRWRAAFERVTDWDAEVPAGVGMRPLRQRVASRLLEVEVHHADLGLAYTFRDWPLAFAEEQVSRRLRSMGEDGTGEPGLWRVGSHVVDLGEGPGRPEGAVEGDPRGLLAWLMGRESAGSAGLTVSGDARAASLPEWFPFP
jgi:maleylpyruvate isomerase